MVEVMLFENGLDLFVRDFSAELAEGVFDVLGSDFARTVDIKGLENGLESLLSKVFLHVDRCCHELGVVDLVVAVEVHLMDYLFDFLGTQVQIRFFDGVGQLPLSYVAAFVLIQLFEFLLENRQVFLIQVLGQKVDRGLLQKRYALVVLQFAHGLNRERLTIPMVVFMSMLGLFDPRVLDCLHDRDSLFRVYDQHFPQKILAIGRQLLRHRVVTSPYFREHLRRAIAFEWQISSQNLEQGHAE